MAFNFTQSQLSAIKERGSSLLVSAAAGSGKTRVLTERLMDYVTAPGSPCDIDSFLIITYTRSAAAELRSRIISELGKKAALAPLDKNLRRQQNLCYRAQIGTIHSFCTDVLRENCHKLGLSPAFRVMDEDRAGQMKQSVLERILEKRYESIGSDDAFRLLADTVGAGRDDSRLARIILELYEKLRSHPYPEEWAAQQKAMLGLDGVTDAGETCWGGEILSSVRLSALYWSERMDSAVRDIYSADEKIIKAYGDSFSATAEALRDFVRSLDSGWDSCQARLPIPFPRLGQLRAYPDAQLAERVKAARLGCKDASEGWSRALAGSSEKLIDDMRACAPAMGTLLDLASEFEKAFSAEKRRLNFLDFSDLEHLTMELLIDRDSGGPTDIALQLSKRYTEIMVDEYQDVNAVQEMIFTAVSRGGNNLFMVGDVKQSIYRFRLADISIFMDKYRRFAPVDSAVADGAGRKILLRENFRSRKCVLDAANHVFSNIMSPALGEMDYDEAAALKYGAVGYDISDDAPAELDIIDMSQSDDEESPLKLEGEAAFVAGRIASMISAGAPVCENGVSRPCRYSDFAILLRSPGTSGGTFHRVLESRGIPVQSGQGGGFFSSMEITVSLNMLAIIDNPHSDVSLISVLRSPAFGFTPDELSHIRACCKDGDFYAALTAAAGSGMAKAGDFLSRLSALRLSAADLGVSELLWRIYEETGLFTLCLAMEDGEARRSSLMQLFDYAREFENNENHGIFRFVAWLRRLAERGEEPPAAGYGDAVKIMSIHKSKGLEFPFVFLCDMSHRFNRSDTSMPVLIHPQLGLGPKRTDLARGIEFPTLARRAIESRMTSEMLSEEVRVLYVAMTRAKERLFMTCTWKNASASIEKLRPALSSPIAPEILRAASSPLRWLVSAAVLPGGDEFIKTEIISSASGAETVRPSEPEPEEQQPVEEWFELLSRRLDFAYPYPNAELLPTKLTATGIKELAGSSTPPDAESVPLLAEPDGDDEFRRPCIGDNAPFTAAQRGTVTHAALQYMDLSKLSDIGSIRQQLQQMTAAGRLSADEATAVDVRALAAFGSSELCRRILHADEVRREFRFTLLVDAEDYFAGAAGEQILMQGVVDCYIVEDGQITVIDYKTDNISPRQIPGRTEHYAPQVRAYAKALERICSMPVRQCLLYFLRCGRESPVSIT